MDDAEILFLGVPKRLLPSDESMPLEINQDDELAELATRPGTTCEHVGEQLLLLRPGRHEVMVRVINGKTCILCTAKKAAKFGLYPK